MRKGICWLLAALLLALACSAGAEDWTEENPETGYSLVIRDAAGLLEDSELQALQEAMGPVTQYASAGFLTWPADGNSTAGATKAQQWGDRVFGYETRYTVFIIDMATRHLDIYASRPLSGVLTAAEENSIADNVYRMASAGRYGDCAAEAFRQIGRVLRGEKIATPMKYVSKALLALIVAIFAAYLLISGRARKEQEVSMPTVVKAAAVGGGTLVLANKLKRVVHHESSSGGGGGGFGGGGGGGGGGSSGGHGF